MSEPDSTRHIKVTAQERVHPAIRKLARACIALARQLSGPPALPAAPERPNTGQPASQEQPHD